MWLLNGECVLQGKVSPRSDALRAFSQSSFTAWQLCPPTEKQQNNNNVHNQKPSSFFHKWFDSARVRAHNIFELLRQLFDLHEPMAS